MELYAMQAVFGLTWRRYVQIATVGWFLLNPGLSWGQEDDEPPRILRGGIVHQLRALTESAFAPSTPKNYQVPEPPPLRYMPSGRDSNSSISHPDYSNAVPLDAGEFLGEKPVVNRSIVKRQAPEPIQRKLPEVVTAEEARQRALAGAHGAQVAAGQSDVHVEVNLPPEVRAALGNRYTQTSPTSSGKLHSLDDLPIQLPVGSTEISPPRVARIPLPTANGPNISHSSTPNNLPSSNEKLQPSPSKQALAGSQSNPGASSALAQPNPKIEPETAKAPPMKVASHSSSSVMVPTVLSPSTQLENSGGSSLPSIPSLEGDYTTTKAKTATDDNIITQLATPGAGSSASVALPEFRQTAPTITPKEHAVAPGSVAVGGGISVDEKTTPVRSQNQPSSSNLPHSLPNNAVRGAMSQAVASAGNDSELLDSHVPRTSVLLKGPKDIPLGVAGEYVIEVHNDDVLDLSGILLRLDLPTGVTAQPGLASHGELEMEAAEAGASVLTWNFENLQSGNIATAKVQLTATAARNFALALEWTVLPLSGNVGVEVRQAHLLTSLEGPSEVLFGQPNSYRLRVKNEGTAIATGTVVTLSAGPYGENSSELGDIPPGGEEIIDVELTFNQNGVVNIAATASSGDQRSDSAIGVLVRQANLVASILADDYALYGAEAGFLIQIKNQGDASATNIMASVALPTTADLTSPPQGATLQEGVWTWTIPQIGAGESVEFPLRARLQQEGKNTLEFACVADAGVTAEGQVETFVEAIADLKLIVNDPVGPAPIGQEVVYELVLTNRGAKAASGVKVVAQFSEGIEPIRAEGQANKIIPGQVLFNELANLGPSETIKLRVFAKTAVDGIHRFRAEVKCNESEIRLVQEESTQYFDIARRIASPAAPTLR